MAHRSIGRSSDGLPLVGVDFFLPGDSKTKTESGEAERREDEVEHTVAKGVRTR